MAGAGAPPGGAESRHEALAVQFELDKESVDHLIKPYPNGLSLGCLDDFVNSFALESEVKDLVQSLELVTRSGLQPGSAELGWDPSVLSNSKMT